MSKRKVSKNEEVIYMIVSKDQYELPMDIDTNLETLATKWGYTKKEALNYIRQFENGALKHPVFERVVCEKADENYLESGALQMA